MQRFDSTRRSHRLHPETEYLYIQLCGSMIYMIYSFEEICEKSTSTIQVPSTVQIICCTRPFKLQHARGSERDIETRGPLKAEAFSKLSQRYYVSVSTTSPPVKTFVSIGSRMYHHNRCQLIDSTLEYLMDIKVNGLFST